MKLELISVKLIYFYWIFDTKKVLKSFRRRSTDQQRQENKEHSKIRIAVKQQFARLKKFRILGEMYRNFRKKHNLRFNIIAGIVNLQAGF